MTNATNTQALNLEAKHGDAFGQLIFGQLKHTLGGENGKILAEAYASRTALDKVTYYTSGTTDAVKDLAGDAYDIAKDGATAVKDGMVKGYETVKGWFTNEQKTEKADEPPKGEAANIRARFTQIYNTIERSVEYKPQWANGTGYFNGIVEDTDLMTSMEIGEMVKSFDPTDGRAMIIILTALGLIVLFERYADKASSFRVNADEDLAEEVDGFREHCTQGVVSMKGFDILFGKDNTQNLGQLLANK